MGKASLACPQSRVDNVLTVFLPLVGWLQFTMAGVDDANITAGLHARIGADRARFDAWAGAKAAQLSDLSASHGQAMAATASTLNTLALSEKHLTQRAAAEHTTSETHEAQLVEEAARAGGFHKAQQALAPRARDLRDQHTAAEARGGMLPTSIA
jgi:hypothetical protein